MQANFFTALAPLLFFAFTMHAQVAQNHYWVQFKDKPAGNFSTAQPEAYLSARAIERRQRYGIAIAERDLPVHQAYIDQVRNLGVQVRYASKWMNGVVVLTADSSLMQTINALPFVQSQMKLSRLMERTTADEFKEALELYTEKLIAQREKSQPKSGKSAQHYGKAQRQISMLNGDKLHELGYRGEGMWVAVLDAGFPGVDSLPLFSSLQAEARIPMVYDVVAGNAQVFDDSRHGMQVLSTMATNEPGTMVGTAPQANYLLLRTEDADSEYLIEEYHWIRGAEIADSAGADIINSSLGYINFDWAWQSHTFADLNGNTTPISRGANIAAATGMLVVNSAGNNGNGTNKFIGAPADAPGVLSIGAVDSLGLYAGFSSIGPTADGRIKPNVVAMGQATALASPFGGVSRGNGTSFSGPVVAGMVACLWQAHREFPAPTIIKAIEMSAHQYSTPDEKLGFGIPDFEKAHIILTQMKLAPVAKDSIVNVYPNPFIDGFTLEIYSNSAQQATITITDMKGRKIDRRSVNLAPYVTNALQLNNLKKIKGGNMIVTVETREARMSRNLMQTQ